MSNPIPDKDRSDHLFLTVGTNPLPNYVSAMLLSKKSSTIYLLHSDGADGAPSTKFFAENLKKILLEKDEFPGGKIILRGINDAARDKIEPKIGKILKKVSGQVGLNYTGGTKPMSVHTYRVLEENFPRATFSYLDARKLAMRIEGVDKPYSVVRSVTLTLDELTALHGYERSSRKSKEKEGWAESANTPGLLELCDAIALVHTKDNARPKWRKWTNSLDNNKLPTDSELRDVRNALEQLCGGKAAPDEIAKKLKPNLKKPELRNCQSWFQGYWLEEHTLACVEKVASSFQIGSREKSLTYIIPSSNETFELDVAAMLGYQLFAISCKVAQDKKKLKPGLLEVYLRARQLGGDEARVGLVCSIDNPEILEDEIRREWHTQGRIKVFGRDQLKDLSAAFADWFRTANG